VFGAILKNATRLCSEFGNLLLYENGAFRRVALYGAPRARAEATNRQPVILPNAVNPLFRIVRTRQVVHIPDMKAEQVYLDGAPDVVGMVEQSGARTIAAVPMIRDEELVGAIAIYRQQVRPFTDKQIEVVKNFAAEAVIAIENARLLNELRLRTADLTESLEQQTATAEVLRVISSSPSKLDPVFPTPSLANATKLCAAHFGCWRSTKMALSAPSPCTTCRKPLPSSG
jgi:GAF domain-containing protein